MTFMSNGLCHVKDRAECAWFVACPAMTEGNIMHGFDAQHLYAMPASGIGENVVAFDNYYCIAHAGHESLNQCCPVGFSYVKRRVNNMRTMILAAAAAAVCLLPAAAMAKINSCSELPQLRQSAEAGNAEAEGAMGALYWLGSCVTQNYSQAVVWWRKSSEHGNADAQSALASAYASGTGVRKDLYESARWYRRAADQGVPQAQSALGVMYALWYCVDKNIAMARYWLQTACRNGDQNGCALLNKL